MVRLHTVLAVVGLALASGWALGAQSSAPSTGLKVRHVHVWVNDVEQTKAFYRDKIGLTVSAEDPGRSVQFENGQLWFGKKKTADPLGTNALTIGLGASSVDAAYRALKARGADVPQAPEAVRDEWHFMMTDPNGYPIEVEGPK